MDRLKATASGSKLLWVEMATFVALFQEASMCSNQSNFTSQKKLHKDREKRLTKSKTSHDSYEKEDGCFSAKKIEERENRVKNTNFLFRELLMTL